MASHQILPDGSTNAIYSVDYSPDGKHIAAGSLSHRLLVWDTQQWKVRKYDELHADGVSAVRFSPDSSRIVTGGLDKVVKIINTSSLVAEISLGGSQDYIQSVDFLGQDGIHFVSTGYDKIVRVWTIDGQVRTLEGMGALSHSLHTSRDGRHIIAGNKAGEIFIWNPQGEIELKLTHHDKGVHAVAFARHTNDLFATAGGGGKVTVWNRTTGDIHANFRGHNGYIRGLAFSPNGKWLISGGQDAKICLWNLETFKLEEQHSLHTNTVYSLAFSPDSKHFVSGSFDRQVIHWSLD